MPLISCNHPGSYLISLLCFLDLTSIPASFRISYGCPIARVTDIEFHEITDSVTRGFDSASVDHRWSIHADRGTISLSLSSENVEFDHVGMTLYDSVGNKVAVSDENQQIHYDIPGNGGRFVIRVHGEK